MVLLNDSVLELLAAVPLFYALCLFSLSHLTLMKTLFYATFFFRSKELSLVVGSAISVCWSRGACLSLWFADVMMADYVCRFRVLSKCLFPMLCQFLVIQKNFVFSCFQLH
eukprot:TRINITY_DN7988_c2_g1_i1.p2 TRINITY_DN7988_c2_g1~~TRINITY_DN7988_c2_g1_i1.p2  ORF type:complete len:111 (-),score=10.55 TRINITY_DN7988_c2_g1_i1:87-419(-)